tara:strand:- start:229231 stop:229782 length:552 start_codon:yes stop_codon:yes gene_type:complete
MKIILSFGIVLLLFTACKSSENTATSAAEALQTKQLVENGDFEINVEWANPMATNELNQLSNSGLLGVGNSAGRINLIGTANYMRLKNDSLSVYLPYFGTRQTGVRFGNNSGAIEFDGIPDEYELQYDEGKQRTELRFKMKEDTESYNVFITVYANRNVYVSVNSSQRNSISYEGVISRLEED